MFGVGQYGGKIFVVSSRCWRRNSVTDRRDVLGRVRFPAPAASAVSGPWINDQRFECAVARGIDNTIKQDRPRLIQDEVKRLDKITDRKADTGVGGDYKMHPICTDIPDYGP